MPDPSDPTQPCLLPDLVADGDWTIDLERNNRLEDLPVPVDGGEAECRAQWNSVALFFNLDLPSAELPNGYRSMSPYHAKQLLDEAANALTPGISEALCRYWHTVSYGRFAFGLSTPRTARHEPVVPTISGVEDPKDWGRLIDLCLDQVAEAAWIASGHLMQDGVRWIPSVVLVQWYSAGAHATFGSYRRVIRGVEYIIGDRCHIEYNAREWWPPENRSAVGRRFWGTLYHEYAHNFLEFTDLYSPSGCTGYWDLLGDESPPGRMSEISSVFKARNGWITFKEVISGPTIAERTLRLAPYTTTGEAYKVVPDPVHTPHEYFVLEFRKSTGREVWRPDGGLPDAGLLITHINERVGLNPDNWLLREAPFFDPEFADESRRGFVKWAGHETLAGKLFPQGSKNSFTRSTVPSSRLYGGRDSGLAITDITVRGDVCNFRLAIAASPQVGWVVSERDRAVAGRFSPRSVTGGGEEIFMRNDDDAALLVHREAQWLVNRVERGWIGGWNLSSADRESVGDLDGDGQDEIYVRSPNWAAVLEYRWGGFRSVTVQHDSIDDWNLGRHDWEHVADLNGDGQDEIYVRSSTWAGVFKLEGRRLRNLRLHRDRIDGWRLSDADRELVGRFSQTTTDEIVVHSTEWLGLIGWDDRASRLRLRQIQRGWIDRWRLSRSDWHVVEDLDGDGCDEIFIRNRGHAGVLKWRAGRFRLIWEAVLFIDHDERDDPPPKMVLGGYQPMYAGRFRTDRDGVIVRDHGENFSVGGLWLLTWTGSAMQVKHYLKRPFNAWWPRGSWHLREVDRFVLGDFHRTGTDVADVGKQYVHDGLTDIFIHNAWGTGMVGVNHGEHPIPGTPDLDQIGLTWIQREIIMDER